MKQPLAAVFFGILFIGLAGCAKDHVVTSNDGRMIDSANKPELNKESRMVEYEDAEGRENQIPIEDVSGIKECSSFNQFFQDTQSLGFWRTSNRLVICMETDFLNITESIFIG